MVGDLDSDNLRFEATFAFVYELEGFKASRMRAR
jgi:hypothetical protein